MSRFCGADEVTDILAAGEHWRDTALLGERSIFTGEDVWNTANIELFESAFTQNPDDSDRKFMVKLQDQLSNCPPDVKQLAAETMWLLLLCPNNNSVDGKRKNIEAIWSWSEKPFPKSSPWPADAVLSGIGSGGRAFGSLRPLELTFCLKFLLSFRKPTKERQASLVKSPWDFAQWLQQVPDAQARQFRHMLLFLLFPDDFERVFSGVDRSAPGDRQGVDGASPSR